MRGFVCDLALEQIWALNAVLGLKELVCDSRAQLGFEGRVTNAVLGLRECVCDLAEQSWALKAEL